MKHSHKAAFAFLAALVVAVALPPAAAAATRPTKRPPTPPPRGRPTRPKAPAWEARSRRSSSATANRSAASRSSNYSEGDEIRFKVNSDVADEVHVHGYDLMKDVTAGGTVSFDFPADIEGIFEAELEGRKEQIVELPGQPVTWLPFAHALVARQDLPIPAWLFAWGASIVLIVSFFALSAAWRKPRFEKEHWRPLGAGLSRALVALAGAGPLWRDRRLPARCRDLRRPARHRSAGPQLRPHLPLRHHLARLPVLLRPARRHLPARSTPGARSVAPLGRASGRSPVSARPTSPTRRSSAAGRPRSASSPSSGWRSSTAPAAASPSASTRTRPPSPPSSTAATRWR